MPAAHSTPTVVKPRRNILVFQGGGALGAYQVGVFEALLESGRQPDWVVGTSIGAINAALIAGNPPERRLERVREFWARMARHALGGTPLLGNSHGDGEAALENSLRSFMTMAFGLQGFFQPRFGPGFALNLPTPPDAASFYDVAPLRQTLLDLVDFDYLATSPVRLSVGAVDVENSRLSYFDSKTDRIGPEHILASGALPPAFPPVQIGERFYWDGGIYSNTPLDWILHDQPRVHSLCLFATLWPIGDVPPQTLRDVLRRSKEIQFASRAETIIELEQELHKLRHAVNLLARALAEHAPESPLTDLACLGCGSVFHVVHLEVPRLPGEDQSKDIEFDADRVAMRWQAGLADARRALEAKPWDDVIAPTEGVVVHDFTRHGAAVTPA
jgi:NTE family protein